MKLSKKFLQCFKIPAFALEAASIRELSESQVLSRGY